MKCTPVYRVLQIQRQCLSLVLETVAAILEALSRNLHFAHHPRTTLRVGIYRYKYSRPCSRVFQLANVIPRLVKLIFIHPVSTFSKSFAAVRYAASGVNEAYENWLTLCLNDFDRWSAALCNILNFCFSVSFFSSFYRPIDSRKKRKMLVYLKIVLPDWAKFLSRIKLQIVIYNLVINVNLRMCRYYIREF